MFLDCIKIRIAIMSSFAPFNPCEGDTQEFTSSALLEAIICTWVVVAGKGTLEEFREGERGGGHRSL